MKRLQPLFPSSEAEEIRKRVRALLPHKDASASATGGIRAAGHLSEFEFYMEAEFVTGVVADEIETYLGYNPPPPGQSILDFWKSQEAILPELSKLARQLLSVQASSTSSER